MMASRRRFSGGRGLVGGDVATPAPTSLNGGRGGRDVGVQVLPLGSSSSTFGDDVAVQLNGELAACSGGRGSPWRDEVER